jgi:hypothetical protein
MTTAMPEKKKSTGAYSVVYCVISGIGGCCFGDVMKFTGNFSSLAGDIFFLSR